GAQDLSRIEHPGGFFERQLDRQIDLSAEPQRLIHLDERAAGADVFERCGAEYPHAVRAREREFNRPPNLISRPTPAFQSTTSRGARLRQPAKTRLLIGIVLMGQKPKADRY